jgi:hypothetical protein
MDLLAGYDGLDAGIICCVSKLFRQSCSLDCVLQQLFLIHPIFLSCVSEDLDPEDWFPDRLEVQEQRWGRVASVYLVALNDLCDRVVGVADVPPVKLCSNLSTFFTLLLLLLLVPLLL